MNFTTETSLEDLCRTCMRKGKDKTISIFDETVPIEDQNVTIIELLLSTTPQLNIEKGDKLPKVLCENCLERLINACKFQKMCIRVEKTLQQMFKERSAFNQPSKNICVIQDKDVLNLESDDPLLDVPLVDIKKTYDKDVKFATEENQRKSDSSYQFEDDIISEDSEWEVHPMNVSKSKKLTKTLKKKVRNVSSDSRKNTKQNIKHKKICNENSNNNGKSKTFVCDVCGSRLKSQGFLNRHKKIHINPSAGQKSNQRTGRHECEFCKKVFKQLRTLKEHQRIHTGEQPYLCSDCGKAFNNSRNMQQHLLRHSAERPYECPYCPKRFRCSSDLAAHKTVHNKKKPHICDVCGSGFAIPYLLKKHKRYHTGERNYKCDFCEMRFFVADHCRRHMRTHTGEKPYKCKYCERAFAQSNDMIKHLRVHLGDNVYKCDLCPQGYPLQRDLRAHFYTHKTDDEETKARNLQALKDEEQKIKKKFELIECK